MKRALSLILVLAMVLCMIPCAFAEDADWSTSTDFVDGAISLTEDNNWSVSYLYTAPETGTVFFGLSIYTTDDNGDPIEGVYLYVDGEEYDYSAKPVIELKEGDKFEVEVYTDDIDAECYLYANFAAVPGTYNNPYYLSSYNTTVVVPANGSVWYQLYAAENNFIVAQGMNADTTSFSVYHENSDEKKVANSDDYTYSVSFLGVGNRRAGTADKIQINNRLDVPMYYVVTLNPVEGSQSNPISIWGTDWDFECEVSEGGNGKYFTYTATGDGTLTINTSAYTYATNAETGEEELVELGWLFSANNMTTYQYGDTMWSDTAAEDFVNTMEVSKGDEIQIMANTYDPDNMWTAPAGTVVVNLSFEAAPEEPAVEEEPIVAEYNGEQMGLNAAIAAAAANASEGNEQTVKLIADYDDEDATIIIEPYVILDTAGLSITAKNIIGLTGSSLQCSSGRFNGGNLDSIGTINVGQNNLVLSDVTVAPTSTSKMKVMPYWMGTCYALGNLRMNDDSITYTFNSDAVNGDGLYVSNFKHGGATYTNDIFADNGSTDHGIRFVVRAEWSGETGSYVNEYTYNDEFVKIISSDPSKVLVYQIAGLTTTMSVDLSTFKVTPMIITDCGAVYYGKTIVYSAE